MDLKQTYNPQEFEDDIYRFWLEKGYFKSKINPNKKPYTIVIPPPNVTGMLHMGHILNNTIQDILIRYYRMNGYEACWIPGTDHASIATETKVVKWLKDMGIDKYKIGREKFLEYAYQWKEKYGGIIISQLKKLGTSCDWDRERFTMDPGYYKAVIHCFVKLYKKGLIYKGHRMVNWCPASKSAISDEEVYYKEIQGKLYHIKYPLADSNKYLHIATTRPETMLGDTALAVNPSDKRYKDIIGKSAILPIVNRKIKIIADDYVDMEFGTGIVKITPAHDPNDYEIGKRHNLEFINIFNDDATLNENVPEKYRGMTREHARKVIVEDLEKLGLIEKIENYTHKVGYSERGHVPIEPYISEQWFLKMEELVKPAIKVVKEGLITFYPERWTKTYFHWLENIKDWCISRQLWWGHRIPVYYCKDCGFYDASEEEIKVCSKCGSKNIYQDEDVLDTWFSSWLWPFAVHKWPEIDENLKYYYPTDTLVTGPDIIFFWVARMIIAGMEFLNEIPFKKVYFTGIIRDDIGRKMSKSLGNSPDPLDVIKEYGADALRYTITRLAPLGNDILYSNEKCAIGRNFANKIWNASRFLFQNLEQCSKEGITPNLRKDQFDIFDKWILNRLNIYIQKIRNQIESFNFNDATISIYEFIWNDFCDWYIEISKVDLYQGDKEKKSIKLGVLLYILENSLKLLHPFMPFITEKIYKNLPNSEESIMISKFPEFNNEFNFENEITAIDFIKEIIYSIRNIRGENKIQPSALLEATLTLENESIKDSIISQTEVIKKLAKLSNLNINNNYVKKNSDIPFTGNGFTVFLSMEGNVDKEKERQRLQKEIENLTNYANNIKNKLNNNNFISKAPANIIEGEKTKLKNTEMELEKLYKLLEDLNNK